MARPTPLRLVVGTVLAWCALVLLGGTVIVVVVAGSSAGGGSASAGGGRGIVAVPAAWQTAERAAVARCDGLPWSILGALGWLASSSGREPAGTPAPWWGWDGGPFGVVVGDGRGRLELARAARHAQRQVCDALRRAGSLADGLTALLGSASAALEVEVLGVSLDDEPGLLQADAVAIDFAVHALGTPYVWGGNGPQGYDCSGLVVAAEHAAGREVPRTAQAQHDASQIVSPPGAPGDLAFFGSSTHDIGHVGLIIGGHLMIDAPHTGAVVRIESYDWEELVDEGAVPPPR